MFSQSNLVFDESDELDDQPEIEASSIDTDEFVAPTPQERRLTKKKDWITSRLCSALDRAKVKRMKFEK